MSHFLQQLVRSLVIAVLVGVMKPYLIAIVLRLVEQA
jgi:hypothetical protein